MTEYKWNENVLTRSKDDGSFGKLLNLCKEHMSHETYKEAYDLAFKAINHNFRAGKQSKRRDILSALDLIDLDIDWSEPDAGLVPITIYKDPESEIPVTLYVQPNVKEDEEITSIGIHENVREWLS